MKFLIDGMLGKLAKWLRLLGYDVEYLNNASDKQLVEAARKGNKILLTSDIQLYRLATARGIDTYLVEGKTEAEKLARVSKRFEIKLDVNPRTSRCTTCNSPLNPVSKQEIKGQVPERTLKAYAEFWRCSNPKCGKIYWSGRQWQNIIETLEEARKLHFIAQPSPGNK